MAHVTATVNLVRQPPGAARTIARPKAAAVSASSQKPDFRAIFTRLSPPAAAVAAPAATPVTAPAAAPASTAVATSTGGPPTAESVFGASPWEPTPTGKTPFGASYNYNPWYFASADTAAKVAQMLGGTVVEKNDIVTSGFVQSQPNRMVEMPDGRLINAGLVAAFYTHGYPQSYIDGLIAQHINGTNV